MKKFLAISIATIGTIGTLLATSNLSCAEDVEGAQAAPREINHSNSIYFTTPEFFEMESTDTRTILDHYYSYQQSTEYTCGPAAALTVLRYFQRFDFDEMELAREMKTQGYPIGTSLSNMVTFFESIGWNVSSSLDIRSFENYEAFQDFVVGNLKLGRPIMVENVEWGGHWRVIIGYDSMNTDSSLDDVLIFVDPYDTSDHSQDGYSVGNGERFFSMWFDHLMLPESEREQPWIVAYPK